MRIEINEKKAIKRIKKLFGHKKEVTDPSLIRITFNEKGGYVTLTDGHKLVQAAPQMLLPLIGYNKKTSKLIERGIRIKESLRDEHASTPMPRVEQSIPTILRNINEIKDMIDLLDDNVLKTKTTLMKPIMDVPDYCPFIVYDNYQQPVFVMCMPCATSRRCIELSTGQSLMKYFSSRNICLADEYNIRSSSLENTQNIKHPEYRLSPEAEVRYLPWENLKDFVE